MDSNIDKSKVTSLTINGRKRTIRPSRITDLTQIRDGRLGATDYIIICLHESMSQNDREQLTHVGVKDIEYLGGDVYYLGQYLPNNLSPVQALDCVAGIDVYRNDFKTTELLENTLKEAQRAQKPVAIQIALHPTREHWVGDDGREAVDFGDTLARVADISGVSVEDIEVDSSANTLTLHQADPQKIQDLASVDAIKTLQPIVVRDINNDRARAIIGFNDGGNELEYQGAGQVIAVADTGLDRGNKDGPDLHPAFSDRILALIPKGRATNCDDIIGHGTHVCGIALGRPVTNEPGGPVTSKPGFERVKGMAPKAELVLQSLLKSDGTLASYTGQALYDLFVDPHKDYKACVHSNSWGDGMFNGQQPYTDVEHTWVDKAMWDNPELLIIMSAGNYGSRSSGAQITGTAACKNVLTVGATDSTRPSTGGLPLLTKKSDNDPTEVGFFSSRGPTLEERIKPEVLAPGMAILSARTQRVRRLGKNYMDSEDPLFCYTYGTSMAAPMVAGCAAVVREYLEDNGETNPPAILVKALLINGAYAVHHAHSAREGFGIVNILNSFIPKDDPISGGYRVETPGLNNKDQSREYAATIPTPATQIGTNSLMPTGPLPVDPGTLPGANIRVTPPAGKGSTLKATMVYNDPPGSALQNNLTLSITDSDGCVRNGNSGSSKDNDRLNNVEQIVWKGIAPGLATIKIYCERLTTAPQSFAVVWRIIPNED